MGNLKQVKQQPFMCDLEAKSQSGNTALAIASLKGYTDTCKFHLHNEASVNARAITQSIPLIQASVVGHADIGQLLLQNAVMKEKTLMGNTALAIASSNGYTDTCKFLLHNEASVNARAITQSIPLIQASVVGHADIGQLLLQNAVMKEKTLMGYTTLLRTSENGHTEVVGYFLIKSGNGQAKSTSDQSPLSLAMDGKLLRTNCNEPEPVIPKSEHADDDHFQDSNKGKQPQLPYKLTTDKGKAQTQSISQKPDTKLRTRLLHQNQGPTATAHISPHNESLRVDLDIQKPIGKLPTPQSLTSVEHFDHRPEELPENLPQHWPEQQPEKESEAAAGGIPPMPLGPTVTEPVTTMKENEDFDQSLPVADSKDEELDDIRVKIMRDKPHCFTYIYKHDNRIIIGIKSGIQFRDELTNYIEKNLKDAKSFLDIEEDNFSLQFLTKRKCDINRGSKVKPFNVMKVCDVVKEKMDTLEKTCKENCGYGSLGCFAKDKTTGKMFGITAQHVLNFCESKREPETEERYILSEASQTHTGDTAASKDTILLATSSSGLRLCETFGSDAIFLDVAMMLIAQNLRNEHKIHEYCKTGLKWENVENQQVVFKVGAVTGETTGWVAKPQFGVSWNKQSGDAFLVQSCDTEKPFAESGDSGALIFYKKDGRCVGLGILSAESPITPRGLGKGPCFIGVYMEYCLKAFKKHFGADLDLYGDIKMDKPDVWGCHKDIKPEDCHCAVT